MYYDPHWLCINYDGNECIIALWWFLTNFTHFETYIQLEVRSVATLYGLAGAYYYVRKQLLLSVRLSHRNSVRPSVCHTGGSGKNF